MGCKKNNSACKHIGHLFQAEISVFNRRAKVSELPSRRPFTLAKYVWLVWRVWCMLFRKGLQACVLGAAEQSLRCSKGRVSPAAPLPVSPGWGQLSVGSLALEGKGSSASMKCFAKKVSTAGQHWSLANRSAESLDVNLILKRISYWQTSGFEGLVHFHEKLLFPDV